MSAKKRRIRKAGAVKKSEKQIAVQEALPLHCIHAVFAILIRGKDAWKNCLPGGKKCP